MKLKALFALAQSEEGVPLARYLIDKGWEIIATANMHDVFRDHGIVATDVGAFVGQENTFPFPPTLHPKMELALTAEDCPERIELVFDQTYGLDVGLDIGGHTLIGLAVKGHRWVLTCQNDVDMFIQAMQSAPEDQELVKSKLVRRGVQKLAHFYQAVANHIGESQTLENGENPYQVPAYLDQLDNDDPLAIGKFLALTDAKPCFTNVADLDAVSHILSLLSGAFDKNLKKVPHIAVAAKHGNACGIGVSWSSEADALNGALWGNPQAVWGGELIVNFEISGDLADICVSSPEREQRFSHASWMLDIIASPHIDKVAREKLSKRARRLIFENPALSQSHLHGFVSHHRSIRGGTLRQPAHDFLPELPQDLCEPESAVDFLISWAAAFGSFAGGNEVALAKNNTLLSLGGGPSTVDAAEIAVWRAQKCGHDVANATFGADAFFPFTDAPQVLVDAGCSAGSVPSGGQRFDEVRQFFEQSTIRCLYWPESCRGFIRH